MNEGFLITCGTLVLAGTILILVAAVSSHGGDIPLFAVGEIGFWMVLSGVILFLLGVVVVVLRDRR